MLLTVLIHAFSGGHAHSEIITPYSEWSSGLSLWKMSVEVLFEKLTQNLQQKLNWVYLWVLAYELRHHHLVYKPQT